MDSFQLLVITCIAEPLARVRERVNERLLMREPRKWRVYSEPLDTRRIYEVRPQPGGAQPLTAVMWSPRSNPQCTVFFPNSSSGWRLLVNRLSGMGMGDSLSVRLTALTERWQVQEFEFWSDRRRVRLFQLLNDEEGWKTFEDGEALSCEGARLMGALKWDAQINREIIITCARSFGFDFALPVFWETNEDAIYIEEIREARK